MGTDLAGLTACELLESYQQRAVSPVEVVQACLDQISAVEPDLNAIVTLCAEPALASARDAERRFMNGAARSLEGVPYGLKDIIATAGIRTTGGSRLFDDYVPERDATVTSRMNGSGAILMAKLQTSELAAGAANFGVVRNPWDLDRLPAGSSSGSAVAVAGREMPLALGTDTGGSIRIPTAFCGITGLKPTYGRISRHGVMPFSWTLDHVGPMARSVEDIALMLSVLAGYDANDPTCSAQPLGPYRANLANGVEGMRIGVPSDWFFDICDSQVAQATADAVATLEAAGARAQTVPLTALRSLDPLVLTHTINRAECASLHEVNLERLRTYSPQFATQILEGHFINAVDYLRALRLRSLVQQSFGDAFNDVDVIVTPGAVGVAPLRSDDLISIDDQRYPWMDVIMRTSAVYNLTGLPALVLPSGLSREGLPMSVQVAGSPFSEAACITVGHTYQSLTDHHKLRPPRRRSHLDS